MGDEYFQDCAPLGNIGVPGVRSSNRVPPISEIVLARNIKGVPATQSASPFQRLGWRVHYIYVRGLCNADYSFARDTL